MTYQITLYSSKKCSFCFKQQKWLERNNIPYVLKDISEDTFSKEMKSLKIPAVPFTIIKTKTDVISLLGFQESILEELLISGSGY
ncbi:glutaredoxin family protein [Bacillus cereus]|uniref:glutaredoxin family protein n=1 Tax=Bacillus cereus TaxID=1396 RepID=UPI000BECC21E|nr:glutaredoxin family protein [Bacillus cereus]PDY77409.1 hypothetical protein CON06_26815 [Bacillus cereus]PFA13197.1 hypothetical protein CN382_14020 [Bacillus cereus]PFM33697.1 hypothetical protein COJ43_25470 [Bacillus cereus]